MEISAKSIVMVCAVLLASCATTDHLSNKITEVYVADFVSDDMDSCRPSDVNLDNREVKEFFNKGRAVDHKVIHDHYNYAPCYIEGTLKYKSTVCEWQIRAGATGYIKCDDQTQYYVCDTCVELFQ